MTGAISDRVSRKAALIPGLTLMAAGVALLALEPTMLTCAGAVLLMSRRLHRRLGGDDDLRRSQPVEAGREEALDVSLYRRPRPPRGPGG